ncbi:hypothetical protein Athai_34970 [Actinocatenispora thailandica]|uniref:DUF3710 domain-containing protein n=1 Tax=Actinocatenispora thailandica TaxID=227318 RepID=A0A7R7DQF1_9ACTN|nr:DUF3710 domain-containing protein [Actinocatenispora thailandica]BCJ35994.1 hypothetical protein Athai_34970 [Actinocatenispora thailandica]
MSLFRRRKANDPADEPEPTDETRDDEATGDAAAADPDEATTGDDAPAEPADEVGDDAENDDATEDEDTADADRGPYDIDDAPDDGLERLDLGSLKIPALPGVEVQIQANEEGEIAAVALIAGPSAVQVGAFAAPRSEGIWDEVRAELRDGVESEGGTVTEKRGTYGPELIGRISTPEGPQQVRFVGIDRPRWFLRAVFHGEAAANPAAAPELIDCLGKIVVERGGEAMPVRDPLPLRLPPEAVEQQQAAAEQETDDGPDGAGR